MKRVILLWIFMMFYMYFGISFIVKEMNPLMWLQNTRASFFIFSVFNLLISFMINELRLFDKKDKSN
jgi:hypothetical protein